MTYRIHISIHAPPSSLIRAVRVYWMNTVCVVGFERVGTQSMKVFPALQMKIPTK